VLALEPLALASTELEALAASASELELLAAEHPTASNSQHHLFFSNAHIVFLSA